MLKKTLFFFIMWLFVLFPLILIGLVFVYEPKEIKAGFNDEDAIILEEKNEQKENEEEQEDTKDAKVIEKRVIVTKNIEVELPLAAQDYYNGKFHNASVASNELNSIPTLKPGDRIEIIGDGYLTFDASKGYTKPGANFYYASGVCWTATTFGYLMDEANKEFQAKYGIPLFTFGEWDRYGHKNQYATYANSNFGYGYAVSKPPEGKVYDYKFTVNPDILNYPELEDLEITITMEGRNDNPQAYKGQSIRGYIVSNVEW